MGNCGDYVKSIYPYGEKMKHWRKRGMFKKMIVLLGACAMSCFGKPDLRQSQPDFSLLGEERTPNRYSWGFAFVDSYVDSFANNLNIHNLLYLLSIVSIPCQSSGTPCTMKCAARSRYNLAAWSSGWRVKTCLKQPAASTNSRAK